MPTGFQRLRISFLLMSVSVLSVGAQEVPLAARVESRGDSAPGFSVGMARARLTRPTKSEPGKDTVHTGAQIVLEERQRQASSEELRVRVISVPGMRNSIRVEETIARDATGQDQVLARSEMAAAQFLIGARKGVNEAALLQALRRADVVNVRRMRHTELFRAQVAEANVRSLPNAIAAAKSLNQLVEYAEPDFVVRTSETNPNDPAYISGELWGLRNTGLLGGTNDADIDANEAWDLRTSASNIIVAVVDTGIRHTHQDLATNMWRNAGEIPGDNIDNDANGVIDDVYGFNAINNDGSPLDDHGHGTHVAGTIGAVGNNGIGVVGVAWNVRLMAAKFIAANGFGNTSDAIEAIDYARQMGAHVLNNSWGGGDFSFSLEAAIDRARQAGILFVASAGNDGVSTDLVPQFPAGHTNENVVSVAASTRRDDKAYFSNFGVGSVDIAAPGEAIYSTHNASDTAYTSFNGTSMASPHVAGAFAMLRAHFPTATMRELIDRLLATADHPAALAMQTRTQGRLNLYRALTATNIVALPVILTNPLPVSVLKNVNATLTVVAQGGAPLSYQWRRNGFVVPGATSASLILSNVQTSDAGRYSVLVSNVSGIAMSSEARVSVIEPVSVVTQPAGAVVPVNGVFTTEVGVGGHGPFWFQWRKNGSAVLNATNAAFAIYGVTTFDAGAYTVVVTNPVSSITSAPAALVVIDRPIILVQPTNQLIGAGGNAVFHVSATGGPLGYQWFKDGVALSGQTSSNCTLLNPGIDGVGSYSVRITNSVGETWSVSATLTFEKQPNANGVPRITKHPTNFVVNAGGTAVFSATASPGSVNVHWRKNGVPIPEATSSTLTRNNVTLADEGVYTLIAENNDGRTASQGAQLTVRRAPTITQQPQSIAVAPGSDAVLEVAATGTAPLVYRWFKDGVLVAGASTRWLRFPSVSFSDSGVYTVSVSNAAGAVSSSPATVNVSAGAGDITWRRLTPTLDVGHVYCGASTPNGIYLGGEDGAVTWSRDHGQTWTFATPAGVGLGDWAFDGIEGLAYGNGRYVGLGWDGGAYSITSLDGTNWARHPAPISARPLHFNNGKFHTVGNYYYWYESTDGVNWSSHFAGSGQLMNSTYGAGRYVVVGQGISSSPDANTWSPATGVPTNQFYWSVTYGGGLFVAVGHDGSMAASRTGTNWWGIPPITRQHRFYDVTYGNGRFVAVGGDLVIGQRQAAITAVSTDGTNWWRTSNPTDYNLWGVTFHDGHFYAHGDYGRVLISTNGEQWTKLSPAEDQLLRGIAHGNGQFVTVGWDHLIRTSRDGLNWATTRQPVSQQFKTVAYGAGTFVIGSDDGTMFVSTNGVSWRHLRPGAGPITSLQFINNQFFALTEHGQILRSSNGTNWSHTLPDPRGPLNHLTWDGAQYVVVGSDGTILRSADGNMWTRVVSPTVSHLEGVAYGNGRFVAVGGYNATIISTNGVDWVYHTYSTNADLYCIGFAHGLFIAAGYSFDNGISALLTSPDGVTWTSRNFTFNTIFDRIQVLNNQVIAVGFSAIGVSSDATNWTYMGTAYFDDVTYGQGKYVGVGLGGRLYVGPALNNMGSQSVDPDLAYSFHDVAYGHAGFVAGDSSARIFISRDGTNWAKSPATVWLEKLTYGAGRYVGIGGSAIASSSDGTNWTYHYANGVYQWTSITYGGGKFVAAGVGAIMTSPDGVTWTRHDSLAPGTYLYELSYGNGVYAAYNYRDLYMSPDGINWAPQLSTDLPFQAMAFAGGRFIASQWQGKMYMSSNGFDWAVSERETSRGYYSMMDYEGAAIGVGEWGIISVLAPAPKILSQPTNQTVRVGASVAMTATVTNAAGASYQWFKDTQPYTNGTLSLTWPRVGLSASGEYQLRVTALGGTAHSTPADLTVEASPFDLWRIAQFGETNFLDAAKEAMWGTLADPDADKLANLGEYFFGLSPSVVNGPTPITLDGSAGRLRISYQRRINDANLTSIPEITTDLEEWHSGVGYLEEISVVPINSEYERVTVEDIEPVPAGAPRFVRIRLVLSGE